MKVKITKWRNPERIKQQHMTFMQKYAESLTDIFGLFNKWVVVRPKDQWAYIPQAKPKESQKKKELVKKNQNSKHKENHKKEMNQIVRDAPQRVVVIADGNHFLPFACFFALIYIKVDR